MRPVDRCRRRRRRGGLRDRHRCGRRWRRFHLGWHVGAILRHRRSLSAAARDAAPRLRARASRALVPHGRDAERRKLPRPGGAHRGQRCRCVCSARRRRRIADRRVLLFLPYLTGERTPHNDPFARGVFSGLDHDCGPGELMQAAMEGVAFSLLEARNLLELAGVRLSSVAVVGGGARSRFWMQLLLMSSVCRSCAIGTAEGADRRWGRTSCADGVDRRACP